ncbi:MAG: cofactor-independent phosphoglycerate mutase [Paludibacteraceae bacterium]|nr:cofactor-independent phosphoglycerate mutase [Paludibacteraceae bacterium]
MKSIIILGDGMADEPISKLGGKTVIEAAKTPYMDMLAKKGRCGIFATVPDGFKPGSEIANMEVLGYSVAKCFEGRGSLEAASMGVNIEPGEMAMRCNLICIEGENIKNHSAGYISTEEAKVLIDFLQEKLGGGIFSFHSGITFKHLLKMKGGDKRITCTPPHDVPGTPYRSVMIKANCQEAQETADKLNELTLKSMQLLKDHPINKKRIAEGKDPANSIWVWSPGYKPSMNTLAQKYGIKSGSVISAVDLIKGIGVYAGLKSIDVKGATGLYDTNYEGKAQAAIEALKTDDFVFLHVEASDEAGHEGDIDLKVKTVEYLDSRIIGPIYEAVKDWKEPVTIAVLPDHPTPCAIRTHTNKPVPFIIYRPGMTPDDTEFYSEKEAQKGAYGLISGEQFIKLVLNKC